MYIERITFWSAMYMYNEIRPLYCLFHVKMKCFSYQQENRCDITQISSPCNKMNTHECSLNKH